MSHDGLEVFFGRANLSLYGVSAVVDPHRGAKFIR